MRCFSSILSRGYITEQCMYLLLGQFLRQGCSLTTSSLCVLGLDGDASSGWVHSDCAAPPRDATTCTPQPQQAPNNRARETWKLHSEQTSSWTNISLKTNPRGSSAYARRFRKNYPGEHIDNDSMPSLRLLSPVHEALQRKYLKYIPCQLRLSQKQHQEAIKAKATKMSNVQDRAAAPQLGHVQRYL